MGVLAPGRAERRAIREPEPSAPGSSARLTAPAQRELVLALLLILCYGFFHQVPLWNENSRYDLVRALVDDQTTRIDPYHENTGDKAFYDGHYYSDKAPGSSLLAVPSYLLLRGTSRLAGAELTDHDRIVQALAFDTAAVPTVLVALLLLRFLRPPVGEWWALTVTVGYALGTLAFPFATMYFGHAATTFFLFASFYLLWRGGAGRRPRRWVAAGFLAGWAVLVDVAALLGVAVLLVYALGRDRRAPLLMAIGALPPAVALLAYNWVSFGGPFSLGYTNLANSGFGAAMGQGILGVTLPKPAALGEILIGPRGLLRLSPWLALAPLGIWAARRPDLRREVALCAAICLAFLVSNAGYFGPVGGASPGPRFLTPALPFAAILVAVAPRALRPLTALLIACSLPLVLVATATMPNALEGVKDPLVDLWLPRFVSGYLAETTAWLRWGLTGAQPLAVLALAGVLAVGTAYATARPVGAARPAATAGIGLLAALVLGFGTPLDLSRELGPSRPAAASGVQVDILEAGVSVVIEREAGPKVISWAQLENRGEEPGETMVVFSAYAPSGERVWSDRHGGVRWRARERKRLHVEWSPSGVPPGEYRVGVAVTTAEPGLSLEQQRVLARVEDAGRVRIGVTVTAVAPSPSGQQGPVLASIEHVGRIRLGA